MLKIYTDSSLAPIDHRIRYLLHPIRAYWGDGTDRWDEYKVGFEFYKHLYEIVDTLEEADLAILPMTWNYYTEFNQREQALAFAEQVQKAGKYS